MAALPSPERQVATPEDTGISTSLRACVQAVDPAARAWSDIERARCETECLLEIAAGDADAFEQVFRAYYGPLVALAHSYVQSHDLADDVVQGMFIALWERRAGLAIHGDLRHYLRRAVRNACLNAIRDARTNLRYCDAWVDGAELQVCDDPFSDDALARQERKALCVQVLRRLPVRVRQVAQLRFLRGMSREEIAAVLGTSPNTVRNQLAAAIRALRAGAGLVRDGT